MELGERECRVSCMKIGHKRFIPELAIVITEPALAFRHDDDGAEQQSTTAFKFQRANFLFLLQNKCRIGCV